MLKNTVDRNQKLTNTTDLCFGSVSVGAFELGVCTVKCKVQCMRSTYCTRRQTDAVLLFAFDALEAS